MELSFGVTSHAKHAHSTGLLARRWLCSMLLDFVRKLNCHSETDDTRRSRRQRTEAKYLQAGSATAAGGGREPVTEVVVVEEVVVAAAGDELQVVAQVVRHATGRLVRCFEQAGEPAALRASGRSEDVGGRLVRSEAGRGEMEIDRCWAEEEHLPYSPALVAVGFIRARRPIDVAAVPRRVAVRDGVVAATGGGQRTIGTRRPIPSVPRWQGRADRALHCFQAWRGFFFRSNAFGFRLRQLPCARPRAASCATTPVSAPHIHPPVPRVRDVET